MRFSKRLSVVGIVTAAAAWSAMGGAALATFPNFSDCPSRGLPSNSACIDIQSQSGEFIIKGFRVPLDHSLEIRGAVREPELTFIPPTGTNGFFATPVNVPGGLLGFELPIGLNLVLATAELAGTPSQIHINPSELEIEMPLKVRLSNPLIGSNCHIGSNSHPVRVHLIVGTTSPPPPNRPISGRVGTIESEGEAIIVRGSTNVDNSFSIPGATECGGLGLLDLLVDAKLQIPSAAGNNTIVINNDSAIKAIP
jgi:hypothetical protein